jgi:hypothetical protein
VAEQAFWFIGFEYFLVRISGLEYLIELEEIYSVIYAGVDLWKLHAMKEEVRVNDCEFFHISLRNHTSMEI